MLRSEALELYNRGNRSDAVMAALRGGGAVLPGATSPAMASGHPQGPGPWDQPSMSPPDPSGGGWGYGSAPPQVRTNGLAIASLVLGILWLYWLGSLLALVFGYIALGQIRRAGGWQEGRGLAIAGVVLGGVGAGTLALLLVVAAGTA